MPPFPPPDPQGHKIPLGEAQAMTKRHRDGSPPGAERAQAFPRDVFEKLLSNPKAVGIRIYHGKGVDGKGSMIAVGVDSDGNDIIAAGEIYDRGFPCPPFCTGAGGLNG